MKQKLARTLRQPDILRILRWTAWGLAALIALMAWPAWKWVGATYGPYSRQESQCLICHRVRITEQVYGQQPLDQIETNEYSDWLDTFVPEHEHVWSGSTGYHRGRWFGSKGIACGGIPTLSHIYRQREKIGEERAQRLVLKFHELVAAAAPSDRYQALDAFADAIHNDPQSLLEQP